MYWIEQMLTRLWRDKSGLSSVEYALLLTFVAAAIVAAAVGLAIYVGNEMTSVATCIETGGSSGC